MLDCKMTSLSPATPINILSECYGIWEHENLSSSVVTKLEPNDMMEFIEPSLGVPTSTHCPASLSSIHQSQNRDYHFQTSQYLTPLPSLGNESYSPADCQMLDSFHCIGNLDSAFHKFSDPSSSYSESYDSFIPDLSSQNHHHQQAQHLQHTQQQHSHHHQTNHQHQSLLSHSQAGNVHIGPQHSLLGSSPPFSMDPEPSGPAHHDYMWDDLGCDPNGEYLFLRKQESPTTSDSISFTDTDYIDSEMDSKSSRESLSTLTEIRNMSPPKRRVGRPPKKDKKMKRTAEKKTGRLWEFIRDLLKNPEYCPSLVRWENHEEGHFRFVNSEKVAQLWGQIKGNPRMTYEKLSRAMRYYYKSHVFEPVLGRRLVYKFGYNATNWRPINPNFVQKLYN